MKMVFSSCLAWALAASFQPGALATTMKMQPEMMKEVQHCLTRMAPLPKAEGYGALCTSIEALYREKQVATTSFLALEKEAKEAKALKARIEELEKHNDRREAEWQAHFRK